mmetsp:Transcript_56882/g.166559  ORF Transcript_56882/g.166559 Transcript_56882/m.166559 type:complete len:284 (+) Transcript_56882:516-1367(+)
MRSRISIDLVSQLASIALTRASVVAARTASSLTISPRTSAISSLMRAVSSTRSSASISPMSLAMSVPTRAASGDLVESRSAANSSVNLFSALPMVAAAALATSSVKRPTSAKALYRSLRSSARSRWRCSTSPRTASSALRSEAASAGDSPRSGAPGPCCASRCGRDSRALAAAARSSATSARSPSSFGSRTSAAGVCCAPRSRASMRAARDAASSGAGCCLPCLSLNPDSKTSRRASTFAAWTDCRHLSSVSRRWRLSVWDKCCSCSPTVASNRPRSRVVSDS